MMEHELVNIENRGEFNHKAFVSIRITAIVKINP